jgi:ATP-dependent helicase/nuclease subunit B
MECSSEVPDWRNMPAPTNYGHLNLIPCAHGEEEARVIALLVREALETSGKRIALVTPDEGLMERTASHLARYGIVPNRIKHGALASTETGSMVLAMLHYVANPARSLPLLSLLRHKLLTPALDGWLREAEPKFRGLVKHQPGQMPQLPPELRECQEYILAAGFVRGLAGLNRRRQPASAWVAELNALLKPFKLAPGEGAEAVHDALAALSDADMLGDLDHDGFSALATEALRDAWRGGIYDAHPAIAFLTPVEARLQQFDRVILANMQDAVWPGLSGGSAWLNLTQRQALGLPAPEEHASLMAHDLLLLGSHAEVFLTWPERESGSPTTRSRFIERLVALLAVHGIAEETLHADRYLHWAHALYAAEQYRPSPKPMPTPPAERRPAAMAVSRLDRLATDPYWLYAYYVLGLRELDPIDKEPEASELGTLIHGAMARLTAHWNAAHEPASDAELRAIREAAMQPFAANPEAALFWDHRLARALAFVNGLEAERRMQRPEVEAEKTLETTMGFHDATLTLHGRIDRLENGAGDIAIGDYKTGAAPKQPEISSGRAPQLLAYALMLEAAGKQVGVLDYWELPGGNRPGNIQSVSFTQEMIAQLHEMIGQFLDPATPLLAKPTPKSERFDNPYDGISRYDEWAG